ncbi:hypothetical protein [Streptomyces sp. NPDC014995]|uniref:hypothetical protein n=1 Tax=Streptomyces sp. NPDC014995 TaxID=3364936 RepID=UPI00370211D7
MSSAPRRCGTWPPPRPPAGSENRDIAAAARFLALPEAEWVNGRTLTVNGGSWV